MKDKLATRLDFGPEQAYMMRFPKWQNILVITIGFIVGFVFGPVVLALPVLYGYKALTWGFEAANFAEQIGATFFLVILFVILLLLVFLRKGTLKVFNYMLYLIISLIAGVIVAVGIFFVFNFRVFTWVIPS